MLPKMKKAYGIFPPILTIWDKDENYDEKASERYIKWLIDNGTQAIVTCGSTSENTAMKTDEQKKVIEHVVKTVAGQMPVYAGTGKYTTLETLELSKHAKAVGADGLLVILPYYFHPYKAVVMDHFRTIKREVGLPILVYNNPWFAGYEMTAQEVEQLFDEGVIEGVKAAHGDANRVSDLRNVCGEQLTIFYGHDYAALQGLVSGANGWLSGFPATFPKQCRELQDAILVDKDLVKAQKIWDKFLPFVRFFMDPDVNAKVHWLEMLKWAVTVQGVPAGIPRRPLRELDSEIKKQMQKPLEILLS
jgi:4-hydroxy-tetrahydrodipicolinate synthase